jgi:Ubiquitin binding region
VEDGRFLVQLQPIQRFVIGLDRPEAETAGYILSHPKLGIYLREEHFDPEYIQTIQAAFVRWGRTTVERLNDGALQPEQTPAYLLQYHTQHLQDAAAPVEDFLELVEQGWLRAWETFEGGYRGFARDMRLVYEALSQAHTADQTRFPQRLRCQLVLSSIRSIGANTPWELLVATVKAGVLTYRQVAHWLEFQQPTDRAQALGALAPYLPAELRAEVLAEALAAARAIEDSGSRGSALGALAPYLPAALRAEVLAEALAAAQAIGDHSARARALGALAPYLPVALRAEVLAEALAAARAIKDHSARARALGALAPHLPAELLAEALAAARTIENDYYRAQALGALAPYLPAEVLAEALAAAQAIEGHGERAQALGALASHLPAALQAEVLLEALAESRAIEGHGERASALSWLVPHLPAKLQAEVLLEALEVLAVAWAGESRYIRWEVFDALVPHLPAELLAEALAAARAMEDHDTCAAAFARLAPQLSGNFLQQGFEALLDVLPWCRRDQSLFTVSAFFPFLEECLGPKGLEEVQRAIIDTARWFP